MLACSACSAQLKVETHQASGRREAVQIWRSPPSNQDADKYKYKCKNTNTKKYKYLKYKYKCKKNTKKYKYLYKNTNMALSNNIFGSLAENVQTNFTSHYINI